MRGLTVIVRQPSGLRAALELAAANAALGGRARVFTQGRAVAALAPLRDPHDKHYTAAGLPTLAELFEDALGLGVEIIACQSGLALTEMTAEMLDARVTYGGLVSVMRGLGKDRLVVV